MDNWFMLAAMQATDAAQASADAARGWFSLTISAGDVGLFASAVAAYLRINDRLTRLETMVEPMWNAWNLRDNDRRRG